MKTFDRMAAQGDFLIIRVNEIPEGLEKFKAENGGVYVIAHSETGHNHVMEKTHVQAFRKPGETERDLYELFLMVEKPTQITHLRSFDTHEPIMVNEGKYVVKRQREYTPEGFRKAAD